MDKSVIFWSDLISVDLSLYLFFSFTLGLLGISVLANKDTQLLFHTFQAAARSTFAIILSAFVMLNFVSTCKGISTTPCPTEQTDRVEERPETCKHGIDAFEICNEIQPTA